MKLGILVCMLALWGGPVLANAQAAGGLANLTGEPWFLKHLLAVIIFAALMFTLADLGAGVFALLFSLLAAAGYLVAAAGVVGPALKSATEAL